MFKTPDECERKEFINSNPRYKGFCQTYFTAGDEEQFEESRDRLQLLTPSTVPNHLYPDIWDGYKDISHQQILTTFRYIFNKFKKGIFLSIKNNKVSTFLPFSKAKFINEWSDQIRFENNNMMQFFKHICELEGRPFCERKINKIISRWYGNNCLVRYEFPQSENDTGVHHIKSMFEDLCASREIPDIEIFVNRRDFPLLKKDGTEPYDDIWDSHSKPLVSHRYDKYLPILSSTTTSDFADIPIPTIDDWARIKFSEGFYFPKTNRRDYTDNFPTLWRDKTPIAVFRGASTGRGTRVETNPRLKIAYLSSLGKTDEKDGLRYLDAGITDWNVRPRKVFGEPYLQTIEINKLPFGLVKKLSPLEQSNYKYIIHIDGHSAAFRLSLEMAMGSVILKVDSEYKLWFSHLLKPYYNYIPVKSDLSDIYEKIEWCKSHDSECEKIAKNALELYKTTLSKEGIFDYLQSLLLSLRQHISYSYPKDPLETRIEDYKSILTFLDSVERQETLVKNKLSTVYRNNNLIIKHTVDKKKEKENIHEAFVGLKCVNNIAKYTPHFSVVKGITRDYDLITKYVGEKTETFFSWLNGRTFDFDEYIFILYQIGIGLHIAQQVCQFVHADLFPWNILLKDNKKPYECVIDGDTVIGVVKGGKLPVIIDYGKSRVTYKGKCYEFINETNFSTIYDVLCVLMSSLSVIIKAKHIRKEQDPDFLRLVNFISGTDFCPDKFTTFSQARQFVFDNSSFSGILSLELKDLVNFTPLHFCKYLYDNFRELQDCVKVQKSQLLRCAKKKKMKKEDFSCNDDKLLVYYFFQTSYYDEKDFPSFSQKLKTSSFGDYKNSPRLMYVKNLVLTYKGMFELTEEDRKMLCS